MPTPIQVGKNRVLQELTQMYQSVRAYWHFNDSGLDAVRKLAELLTLPDEGEESVEALELAGFIEGNEHLYFG